MNVWMNKYNGELVLAHPQWEPLRIEYDESMFKELWPPDLEKAIGDKKVVKGLLMQVGWMIQNKNDLWFGLPFNAKDNFEDLGEA